VTQANGGYCGLQASTWDLSRGDTSTWTDRSFYLDAVLRHGAPVLDVGCGTGRILLDFLAQGIEPIEGVDNSPDMLAICREKAAQLGLRPVLHQQAMQSLDIPRQFMTILVPSSSFQLLTDTGAAREAMRRFFAHLMPGGVLVMPFGFDWRPGDPLDSGWQPKFEKTRPQDGATVRAYERTWRDPPNQLWHEEERIEVELAGKIIDTQHLNHSPAGRWYTQEQVIELLSDTGFRDIQLFSGFSRGEKAAADDPLFCVIAGN
jgi:ubiquinone/menaquinone biosynthesis C-methylase UbiE